jgi:hypothetical protein
MLDSLTVIRSKIGTLIAAIRHPALSGLATLIALSAWTGRFVFKSPEHFSIAIVGDFTKSKVDIGSQTADQIFAAFRDQQWPDLHGIKVQVSSKQNDDGNPEKGKLIAQTLTDTRDCILVISQAGSTDAAASLPIYLTKRQPPLAVVLSSASNPDILPPGEEEDSAHPFPVLRLIPPDNTRAQTIATRAVHDLNAKSFWVVEDGENPVFTHYLAREFVRRLAEQQGRTVAWSTSMNIPFVPELTSLGIDGVFFAGSWDNGTILAQQVKKIFLEKKKLDNRLTMPKILLSASPDSTALLGEHFQTLDGLEGVYVLNRVKAGEYMMDGYHAMAQRTGKIIACIISEANARFEELASKQSSTFWLRRYWGIGGDDGRNAINAVIQDMMISGTPLTCDISGASPNSLNTMTIAFDRYHNMQGMETDLWKIDRIKSVDDRQPGYRFVECPPGGHACEDE